MASKYYNKEYQQQYQKARYKKLISEERCVMCEEPLNGDSHRYCSKCRAFYNRQQKRRYHERKAAMVNG